MVTSPLTLSFARAQFGFTIAFHIILPAFSIGLTAGNTTNHNGGPIGARRDDQP
jgi:hypothetical protein